jgi:PhoH-like ATPase
MGNRKILVIDTSVLLYDMNSIHSFSGNDVVIPLIVLDELDRFKDRPGLLGESARYVNRYLDLLRGHGKLNEKVTISETEQTIRVELRKSIDEAAKDLDLDLSRGDNRIIATALLLKKESPDKKVKVITKDINLRVKCDSIGIDAEDYFNDHIDLEESEYVGWKEVYVSDDDVDDFFADGLNADKEMELFENQFVVGKGGTKHFIGMNRNGEIQKLNSKVSKIINLEPRNKEQKFAIEALCHPDIPLVTLTGLAGSGKTFLALMCALEGMQAEERYSRIVFTRSIQPVGRDIGYLPGSVEEKMNPWLAPFLDNLRHVFKDTTYFQIMTEKNKIEVAPLSYIRGRTFNDCFVIVDEAQNASIHELKTIITRIGENSKVVLLGDTDQIDTPYIDKKSNGLSNVVEKFKKSPLHAHIHLNRGQRSDLASEASKIL